MRYIFILIVLSVGGCSLLGADDDNKIERTYPKALDLETVMISQLRNGVTPPDSLNIKAFVVSRIICPKDMYCFLPNGIIVAEALNDTTREKQLYLTVRKPQQFEEDKQYKLSVSVRSNSNGERKFFDLLGYTKRR